MTSNYYKKNAHVSPNPNPPSYIGYTGGAGNTINFSGNSIPASYYQNIPVPPQVATPVGNLTVPIYEFPIDINATNIIKKKLPPIEQLKNAASNNTIQFELPAGHIIYYKYKSDAISLNRPSRSYFKRFVTTSNWTFGISQISLVDSFVDDIAREFKFQVKPLVVQVDPAVFNGVELIVIPPYHYLADKFKNSISIAPTKNTIP